MKPARGRNPLAIEPSGLRAEHAITRSVRDSAAILDATQGAQPGDPYHAPPPARPYVEEAGAPPGRLRIGFTTHGLGGEELHADCVAAVEDAARLCAGLGHEVDEASPPIINELITNAFTTVWEAGAAAQIDGAAMVAGKLPSEDQFEPLTWALAQNGRRHSAPALLLAVAMFQIMARGIAHFHETYDVWLTPTLGEPPVPLGSFDDSPPGDPMRAFERAKTFVPFTAIQNATGQPAMSVPLYWNGEGLPVGAHFAGCFGDEATLFRLAAQLEQARPWIARTAAVSA